MNHVQFLVWMKWQMVYRLLNYKEVEGATYLRGKKIELDLDILNLWDFQKIQVKVSKTKTEYSGDIMVYWLRMKVLD